MNPERSGIYRVWNMAEFMCSDVGRPLYAFLALHSVLRQGGAGSAGVLTSVGADLSPEQRNSPIQSPPRGETTTAPKESAPVAVDRIAFSALLKQEELVTRVRAVEYLLYGTASAVCRGPPAPVPLRAHRQPISRPAMQEGLRLAEQLLSPLLTSMGTTTAGWAATPCRPGALAGTSRPNCILESYFFNEANLAPLVWPTLGWCLPSIEQTPPNGGRIAGKSEKDIKGGATHLENWHAIQIDPSSNDTARPIPLALLVKTYVLQASIERHRRCYKRALQLIEAARGVVHVIFADGSRKRWAFLLLEELRARWRLEHTEDGDEGINLEKDRLRIREDHLKAVEAALPLLFSYEQRYCLGQLAVEECRTHHAIICAAQDPFGFGNAHRSRQASASSTPNCADTAAGTVRNVKCNQRSLKESISRLKQCSAMYEVLVGCPERAVFDGPAHGNGHPFSTDAALDSEWISALAKSVHSCCLVSLFNVQKAYTQSHETLPVNVENFGTEDWVFKTVSANTLQLAQVLGFYHCYACILEVYAASPPSQTLSGVTAPTGPGHSTSPTLSAPSPSFLDLLPHLDQCIRMFDQHKDAALEFKSGFWVLRELVCSDSIVSGKISLHLEETASGRHCADESTILCDVGSQKATTDCANDKIAVKSSMGEQAEVVVSGNAMWVSLEMHRAIALYLELCHGDLLNTSSSGPEAKRRIPLDGVCEDTSAGPAAQRRTDDGVHYRQHEQPQGLDFSIVDDDGPYPKFMEALFPHRDTTVVSFRAQIARMDKTFNTLLLTIEKELLALTGNVVRDASGEPSSCMHAASRHDPPALTLRSCVIAQTRFLIQLKAAALMRVVAGNLTQLRLVQAVQHLRELQNFMGAFDRHTRRMRAEMHMLVACLALHLSMRDLPLLLLTDQACPEVPQGGGLMDAFFKHWEEGEAEDLFGTDLIAHDVGLPMAHLMAAEWCLHGCGASGSVVAAPNVLLLQLFKAIALSQVAAREYELELLHATPSPRPHADSSKSQGVRDADVHGEEEEEANLKRPRLEKEDRDFCDDSASRTHQEFSFTQNQSQGFTLRRLALSERRRCADALICMLESLLHRYHSDHEEEAAVLSAGLSNPATPRKGNTIPQGRVGRSLWSPLHLTLLFLLQGIVARMEDRDELAAQQAFQRAVATCEQHFGLLHPCVADGLGLLASVRDTLTNRDRTASNNNPHCEHLPPTAKDATPTNAVAHIEGNSSGGDEEKLCLLSSLPASLLNSSIGDEGRLLTSTALQVAGCTSCSALFRLLETHEKSLVSSSETQPELEQCQFDHKHAFSASFLRNIRMWWKVQVQQLCSHMPVKDYGHLLPAEAPQRSDLAAVLGFLPNMAAYTRLR